MAKKEVKVCDLCGQMELTPGAFKIMQIDEDETEICPACEKKILATIERIKNPKLRTKKDKSDT